MTILERIIVFIVGTYSLIVFGYYTNWQAAVALLVAMWMNNLSISEK